MGTVKIFNRSINKNAESFFLKKFVSFAMDICRLKINQNRYFICRIVAFAGFALLFTVVPAVFAQETFVTIGTGAASGIYYPTGKAIAAIVNQSRKRHGIEVRYEATGGSVFNINAMMMGDLEFGIVQSDRQFQAWNGSSEWEERGPQKRLRSICSFHPESVVLLTGTDAKIISLTDLIGKTVNIGSPGSGPRGNAIDAMQSCGIDWKRRINTQAVRAEDSAELLQQGRVDAFFYTVGHPSDAILNATRGERKVHFVPFTGKCIDELVTRWPYYAKAWIPIEFYPLAKNESDVETFGVKATFCTSIDIPEKVVYSIVKEIFSNLKAFKKLHPAYGNLTKNNMLEALSAPLHPGALKYFKEAGIKLPQSDPEP